MYDYILPIHMIIWISKFFLSIFSPHSPILDSAQEAQWVQLLLPSDINILIILGFFLFTFFFFPLQSFMFFLFFERIYHFPITKFQNNFLIIFYEKIGIVKGFFLYFMYDFTIVNRNLFLLHIVNLHFLT